MTDELIAKIAFTATAVVGVLTVAIIISAYRIHRATQAILKNREANDDG